MILRFIWRTPFWCFVFFSKALSDSILYHSHALSFGKYYDWEDCPINTYANGFEVKADEEEKSFSDEEGMTGLRLRCSNKDNEAVTMISSYNTHDGTWKGMELCRPGEWLTGFRIKIQGYGWWIKDDTAANDIEMVCNQDKIYDGHGNRKGKWTEWNHCEKGDAICAIRTKVEDVFTADRVGLVAVLFRCCSLDFDRVPPANQTEKWTSVSTSPTPNPNGFNPIYFPNEEVSSSSSTRSQNSEPSGSQAPGVTRSGQPDSTVSQAPGVTRSRQPDSSDSQAPDFTRPGQPDSSGSEAPGITRSGQPDSTDSQLSSMTRSHYSDSTDSTLSGVTISGNSDSTNSRLFGATRPRTSDSTDFLLFDVTRSQSSDSSDSPLSVSSRSEQSDSTDSQLFGVTRSQSSDSTDSHFSSVTRSYPSDSAQSQASILTESQSSDSSKSQFPVSTESHLSNSPENQQSFSFATQPSEGFYSQSSSSPKPLGPDSREPRQFFGSKNSQSSVSSSGYSTSASINPKFSASTESHSSFLTKLPYSTESKSSESSSVSIESDLLISTESSSGSSGFRPSDYSSIILNNILTTSKPGDSTQKEIIFPDPITSWELSSTATPKDETNDNGIGNSEETQNPSSVLYENENIPESEVSTMGTLTTSLNINGFSNQPISTSSPDVKGFDEKSRPITPTEETFTTNNFNGNQNENSGSSATTVGGNEDSLFNNRNNGSDKTTETERTTVAVDGSISTTLIYFGSSTIPPLLTMTNWKTSSKPFVTTTSADGGSSLGFKPSDFYEDHGSEDETKTEDDEYVPFGLNPVDEKTEDRNPLKPRIFPTKSPPKANNDNNTDTTEINLNDILFGPKKNESKTFFGFPFNDTNDPRIEPAEEGTAYHDFWSQSDTNKSNTDPNLAIFVMLGLAVTAAVVLSLLGLGYYIKKRKRKMSIDPRYKYVISVRHVKPIDPIISE